MKSGGSGDDELISSTLDEHGTMTYDLALTRVVAGSAEQVRAGLADALERLGYHVVDEQPLVAKRRTTGWGAWGCGTNPLHLATTLHAKIKPVGDAATEVTFNYTVRSSWLTRGDRKVLAREADAAAALAAVRDRAGACTLCGTESANDSRFCRRCGAPLATYEPVELETMRLAAGSQAAAKSIGNGALFVVLGLAVFGLTLFVPELAKNPAKMAIFLMLLAWTLGGMGVLSLLRGYFRLRHTLDDAHGERELGPAASRREALSATRTGRLPAPAEYFSVTEHTTDLLEPGPEPVPLRPRRRTGDVG